MNREIARDLMIAVVAGFATIALIYFVLTYHASKTVHINPAGQVEVY